MPLENEMPKPGMGTARRAGRFRRAVEAAGPTPPGRPRTRSAEPWRPEKEGRRDKGRAGARLSRFWGRDPGSRRASLETSSRPFISLRCGFLPYEMGIIISGVE